jgi:hypothetical protein
VSTEGTSPLDLANAFAAMCVNNIFEVLRRIILVGKLNDFVFVNIQNTIKITGGIVAAKYPAERHIRMAPMIAVTMDSERSTRA